MSGTQRLVENLDDALDGFTKTDLEFIDPVELGGLAQDLGRLQARLDAAMLTVTGAVDRSVVWSDDGALSSKAWLRTRLGCSDTDAKHLVSDARSLADMPLVAEALAAGLITRTHVRVFARACTPERAGLFARDEALLVAKTLKLSFRFFTRAIAYWISLANDELGLGEPDPVDKRTASSHDASTGMWAISAMLDALDGAEVDNELRRLERIEFEADWAEARERLGDDATASDLARTSGQRLADALVEMARRSAGTSKAGEPARRIINLRMDYPTFVAELALMTGTNAVSWPTDRVSETEAGTVLAPSRILDTDVATEVRRAVFDSNGHMLSFGHATRLFTGGLREAIIERDQECVHPYCETAGRKCQVDHVSEYEDGGHTAERNGQLLCGPHNRHKHRSKKRERAG